MAETIGQINILKKAIQVYTEERLDYIKPFFNSEGNYFYYSANDTKNGDNSIHPTSTSTCTWILNEWGFLKEVCSDPTALRSTILMSRWSTANLPEGNAYTTSIVLHALNSLGATENEEKIKNGLDLLRYEIRSGSGGITLTPDIPGSGNSFITFWALTSLRGFPEHQNCDEEIALSLSWAQAQVYKQVALFSARSDLRNIHQLAFAWAICEKFCHETPITKEIRALIIELIFNDQNTDGVWPTYDPLFNIREQGAAYVYHFELMLAVVWALENNSDDLETFLPNIKKIIEWVKTREIILPSHRGWSINSDPAVRRVPLSWATAEVLYVLCRIDKYLSAIHRNHVFLQLVGGLPSEQMPKDTLDDLIDMDILNEPRSVKAVIKGRIIDPIIEAGSSLWNRKVNASLATILFGPPGTSKTTIARAVAGELGWPLLEIDPSHFAPRDGSGLEIRVIEIFSYLEKLYDTVILLDEMDELVRERDEGSDRIQRFWTTLMLPRLSRLRSKAQSIVLVTTNYIKKIDVAAKRFGRFDMVVPIGPPNAKGKIEKLLNELECPAVQAKEWLQYISELPSKDTFDRLLYIELPILIQAMDGQPRTKESFSNALFKIRSKLYLQAEEDNKYWREFEQMSKDFTRL
ncbi:MAG: ATP-binding protein [Proteobacteria bacterium]|nr:ATP-binding protein [Pseudomonadota bacterium]